MKKIIEAIKFYVSDSDMVVQIGYALTIPILLALLPICLIICVTFYVIDEIEANERFDIPYKIWDGKHEYVCWTRKEVEDTKKKSRRGFQ